MCCGYSKPVPGDVWQDAKWIRTITLHWTEKTSKIWSKLTIFWFFSDLLDIYYDPNEHIDMNPIKFCQASSDTNLEYQQGVDWLQMACTASKMAQKGQKMAQNGQFSKILAEDEKWIRTIQLYWTEKTSKMWSKLTIFVVFLTLWAFTMNWMNILTWIL